MSLLPLSAAPRAMLAGLAAVLTDIDDTLTLNGRLPPRAFAALDQLQRAGLKVIAVTGRPAGWCDHIARQWPVDGVVGENGAFYFRHDDQRRQMFRVYAQPIAERLANAARLMEIALRVLNKFPGTAIASDQAYREIDVAIASTDHAAQIMSVSAPLNLHDRERPAKNPASASASQTLEVLRPAKACDQPQRARERPRSKNVSQGTSDIARRARRR